MKIRDLILAVLIAGMVISTGTLVGFAASGINDIKDTTSESSSGELQGIASKNLEEIAIGICQSLDSQMKNQYEMVKTWAKEPAVLVAMKNAKVHTMEELYEMWSAEATRVYVNDKAMGDGKPDNDLSPSVSKYFMDLSSTLNYPEILLTDSRGYSIAANHITSDFDQGPNNWTVFSENGAAIFKKDQTNPNGKWWYQAANEAENGFYVSDMMFDEGANVWGLVIVSQVRDPITNEYLGQLKTIFNYGRFLEQIVDAKKLDVYEIKVVDKDGVIVASSIDVKAKINSEASAINNQAAFSTAVSTGYGNISKSFLDENKVYICLGYAMSGDVNKHIVMVSKKTADISAPIDKFIGTMKSNISEKSTTLQRNMIIIGVVVAVIIIAAAALIMRAKVSIPLKKLTTISDKLSKGEMEGLQIDVHGKDEISKFGESFKGVLAAFNFLKDEVEKK